RATRSRATRRVYHARNRWTLDAGDSSGAGCPAQYPVLASPPGTWALRDGCATDEGGPTMSDDLKPLTPDLQALIEEERGASVPAGAKARVLGRVEMTLGLVGVATASTAASATAATASAPTLSGTGATTTAASSPAAVTAVATSTISGKI